MEWTELHDLNLCEDGLVVEPWQHPYPSKDRGDSWNEIANNLNASGYPTFKVSKGSVRDRLILLQKKFQSENENEGSCLWNRLSGNKARQIVRRNHRKRESGHGCEKPER